MIRTFNALLMIARAESGQARGNMDDFDAADVAKGIQELYEPLAEDNGMSLRVRTVSAPLHGNRELISQALANLVENAIKYGKPMPAAQPLERGRRCRDRKQDDPDRGPSRRRSGAAQRHRPWAGDSRSRPQARGGTICPA